jgi:hypothetical protein
MRVEMHLKFSKCAIYYAWKLEINEFSKILKGVAMGVANM